MLSRDWIATPFSKIELHNPPLLPIKDMTGTTLTKKDKKHLSKGIKIVKLTNKELQIAESEIVDCCNVTKQIDKNKKLTHWHFSEQKGHWEQAKDVIGIGTFIPPDNECVVTTVNPMADLSQKQLTRIKELRQIGIFKKADKGPTLVFMSKEYYRKGALRHLQTDNYQVIEEDPTPKAIAATKSIIDEARLVAPRLWDKLSGLDLEGSRGRKAYFQPKVHKPIPEDGIVKFRPIVDCKFTPLSEIDKFCAQWLKPLYKVMSTVMKDSIDTLKILRENSQRRFNWIATLDVEDLYTNTPIVESIERTMALAKQNGIGTDNERYIIKKLLRVVLTNNTFTFDEVRYLQKEGIPMGSNSSPILADAFMFSLEQPHLDRWDLIGCIPMRYRDDILLLCRRGKTLDEVCNRYNNLHPKLKMTVEVSQTEANFLDIKIRKTEEGELRLGMYHKPTDTLEPLDWSTQHTRDTLKGCTYARALRIMRTVNNRNDFWSAVMNSLAAAARRNYPWHLVIKQFTKAALWCAKTNWPHIKPKFDDGDMDYRTLSVITYARHLNPIYQVLKRRKVKFARKVGKPILGYLQKTSDC